MKALRAAAAMLALLLAAPFAPAHAQANPTLSEAERGIRRGDEGEARRLRIDALAVTAQVVGRTATLTLDLRIAATSATPYEANLSLLMPTDAVVTGYALDVGGRMIPGQLLEQPRARNLYEDEVRQGIDPGLAEVSAGNRFTTRIFPIDAEHPRRVQVTFAAPFDPERGLVLPLARDLVGRAEVRVSVEGYTQAPEVRFAGERVVLSSEGTDWRGGATLEAQALRDGLFITGGSPATPIAVTRHASGERFFAIADTQTASLHAGRGGRLRIYWDRSRSHRDHSTGLEVEALVRLVDATAPSAIDLVTFASDSPAVVTLPNAAALRATLSRVTYRGATSLAGLDTLRLADAQRCVLVSDGQVTIDRGARFAPGCALAVLTAAPGADGARLGRLAQASGGRVVRVQADGAAVAAAALAGPAPVRGVFDAAGRSLPFRALPAPAGGWLLVGPMPAGDAVSVRLTDGVERRYVAPAPIASDAPAALWAAQRVAELADDPARHDAMVAFSRRYGVAGPAMSLLVLETPDQYLRAEMAPPTGFSEEWLASYRVARKKDDRDKADAREARLAQVVAQWRDRVRWWNTHFTPLSRAQVRKRGDGNAAVLPPPDVVSAPPPPPPPVSEPLPPAAAPPPVAEARADADGSNIIVTASRAPASRRASAAARPDMQLDLADLTAKRPYIAALAAAVPGDRLRVLAEQEAAYGTAPTFYLDTAEWFRGKGDAGTAGQLLLSALELSLSDDETRQIVAFRLERDGAFDRAVELAEHLAAANADFRPQPARDLALALAARGLTRGAAGRADLQRAFGLLTDAALRPQSEDFAGFEVVALAEANALIPAIERAGGRWSLDPRLVGRLDTDARIVMGWTADDADIDLWVDEPNGERVFYGDQQSSAGGRISNDMTDGYGPEEYAIRRAPAGAYRVRVNGFDADRINPNGPGHVLLRLQRNFGRVGEQQTLVDLDLAFQSGADRDDEDETRPFATLRVGP